MLKKIENPDISAVDNKKISELIQNEEVRLLVQRSLSPYVHWEKIKHWPVPKGVSNLELWAVIKILRNKIFDRKNSVIKNENGVFFSWTSYILNL